VGAEVIQLAPAKALSPALEVSAFSSDEVQRIANSFKAEGVEIAVLGCYINPIDPDPVRRKAGIARFRNSLKFARDFGCEVVGTETGSVIHDCSFHPDNRSEANFSLLLDSLSEMAYAASEYGVCIGLEAAREHVVYNVDRMEQAIRALDSDYVKVIFDPVNIIEEEELDKQASFFDAAAKKLAGKIAVVHAKDIKKIGGAMVRVAPGDGVINYVSLVDSVRNFDKSLPLIMEETSGVFIKPALEYLRGQVARAQG
jgi:L-ribulose-5-phosphate 3-epimerase